VNIVRRALSIMFLSTLVAGSTAIIPARAATKLTSAVYVAQNPTGPNSVALLVQDSTTGLMTLVDTYPTGGAGDASVNGHQSHALISNGTFLFVTNSGDNTVTSFHIGAGGVLTKVGSYSSEGYVPVSLAVKGSRLIVLNQGSKNSNLAGSVHVLRIKKDGSLTPVPQAHFDFLSSDGPAEVLASPTSSVFSVALSRSNRVDHFILKANGSIARTDSVSHIISPLGGAVASTRPTTFIYTLASAVRPGVVGLSVDRKGRTTREYLNIRKDLADPCWAAIHPNQKRVWLSSFKTRALSLYSINSRGAMKPISDYIPVTTGPRATDIGVDSTGRYLFRLRRLEADTPNAPVSSVVDTLRIRSVATNAGLALVQTTSLPASWATSPATGVEVVSVPQLQ
jgi:6-phosphogluconolactonase (cycloisomerase 2 family)